MNYSDWWKKKSLKIQQTISGNNQSRENKQEHHNLTDSVAGISRYVNTCRNENDRNVNMCSSESRERAWNVIVDVCTCMCNWPVAVRSLNCSSFMRVTLVSSSSCRSSGGMKNVDMLFTVIYTDMQKTFDMSPLHFFFMLKHEHWQTPLTAS